MKEMVGGCCVCSDDRGWPENPLVYCDGQSCTVAVHQACYGIVTVPTGPWYCRKCESQERTARVKCELCPSKYGALKRTDNSGWAHVVCALYIPEVRFGNVTTMEPIQLQLIPPERFSKVCYICEEQSKPAHASVGACMQCNKSGCKQQFHVTCAQALGLLCEEAGNYLDNVKYCGYCQHHYSKLKKGGNVKTIPPYKPVSTENNHSDSSAEKDTEKTPSSASPSLKTPQPVVSVPGKRSKSSSNKPSSTSSTKSSSSSSKTTTSSTSHQKSVHSGNSSSTNNNNTSKSDKDKSKTIKSAKSEDNSGTVLNISAETSLASVEIKSVKEIKTELEAVEAPKTEIIKEIKSGKKRKSNSRTSTPIAVPIIDNSVIPAANLSVIIPELSASVLNSINNNSVEKRENTSVDSASPEKIRKIVKSETVTPISTPAAVSSPSPTPIVKSPSPIEQIVPSAISITPSPVIQATGTFPPVASLVVSVPLLNTNLSPHTSISNQTSVVTSINSYQPDFGAHSLSNSPISTSPAFGTHSQGNSRLNSPDMSGSGGLKIVFEKQSGASSPPEMTVPTKRSRSMSGEKNEKGGRGKKRTTANQQPPTSRRASRSQHVTPPPQTSNIIPLNQIKESPPSSPSSEGGPPTTRSAKAKGRKSAPTSTISTPTPSTSALPKDTKENIKVSNFGFQNGLTAPHMLGNQLNPNSHMAQKMTDHLNSEIEAHSIYNANDQSNLVGPQLHHRVIANVRSNSTGGSSTASGGSGFSMLGGSGGTIPQTLDQLLERQWEQGSQFLMEQAQHFDIASLLSCLHQLRAENLRLEEHVSSLLQRRDHLLAVNARLAIPLTGQPAAPQAPHPHTVNNIHPAVVANHADLPRPRHNSTYPHVQTPSHHSSTPLENGLSESNQGYPLRQSPAGNQSQSSNSSAFRHSPAGTTGYPSSGLMRQVGGDSGGIAPRPQSYPIYQRSATHTPQPQMVIQQDLDLPEVMTTKPS